jgi:hypothetical protein
MHTQVDLLEKEKAAARAVQRSLATSGPLLRGRLGLFMNTLTLG